MNTSVFYNNAISIFFEDEKDMYLLLATCDKVKKKIIVDICLYEFPQLINVTLDEVDNPLIKARIEVTLKVFYDLLKNGKTLEYIYDFLSSEINLIFDSIKDEKYEDISIR